MTKKRIGQVIRLKPEGMTEYVRLHRQVWPDVVKMISECHVINYSIYLKDNYLFAYFEYVGNNFESDMGKMARNKQTQQWWAVVKPLMEPLQTATSGEFWATMDEIFHLE
jgi:L-rhamnose mutarotase